MQGIKKGISKILIIPIENQRLMNLQLAIKKHLLYDRKNSD